MDFSILINWMSPLLILRGGKGGIFFIFISFSMKFMCANRIALDGMLCFAVSHLGLFCLPMSQKKDAGLYELKVH